MGVYSNDAQKLITGSEYVYESTGECFLTSMFYGHAEVVVDAPNVEEAQKFEKLARQDFEVFKRSKPELGAPLDVNESGFDRVIIKKEENGTTFIAVKENEEGDKCFVEVNVKDNAVVKKASHFVKGAANKIKDTAKDLVDKFDSDKDEKAVSEAEETEGDMIAAEKEKDKEKELAKNIKLKMKEYNINDIEVGPNNRFKNYL